MSDQIIEAKKIKKSPYLGESDVQIVEDYGKKKGVDFSAALRMIIREWADYAPLFALPSRPDDAKQIVAVGMPNGVVVANPNFVNQK